MRAEAPVVALFLSAAAFAPPVFASPGTPWTDDTPLPEVVAPPPPVDWAKVCAGTRAVVADDALAACTEAMLRDPENPDLALITGTLLAADGRFDDGLVAIDRAIRLSPDYADAWLQRVRVLGWKGDHATAIERLDEVDARWPDWDDARAVRADLATWQGDTVTALAVLGEDPATPELAQRRHLAAAARARTVAVERAAVGDLKGAGRAWRQVLDHDPADVDAALGLAVSLSSRGDLDEALAVLDASLVLNPGQADVQAQRARVLAWLGEWDDALGALAELRDEGADTSALASDLGRWRRDDERWLPALSPPGRVDAVYGHTFVTDRGDWDLWGATASWREKRVTFGLGAVVERRVYGGEPQTNVGLEVPLHVHVAPRWRVQAILGATPGATYRPLVMADVQPAYEVTRAIGLGFGYRVARYRSGTMHRIAPSTTITLKRVSFEPALILGIPGHGKPTVGEQLKVYFWPEARYMAELWLTHGAEPMDDSQFVFELRPVRQLDVSVGLRAELTDRIGARLFASWEEPLTEDPLGGTTRRLSAALQLTHRFGRKPEASAVP